MSLRFVCFNNFPARVLVPAKLFVGANESQCQNVRQLSKPGNLYSRCRRSATYSSIVLRHTPSSHKGGFGFQIHVKKIVVLPPSDRRRDVFPQPQTPALNKPSTIHSTSLSPTLQARPETLLPRSIRRRPRRMRSRSRRHGLFILVSTGHGFQWQRPRGRSRECGHNACCVISPRVADSSYQYCVRQSHAASSPSRYHGGTHKQTSPQH